MPIEKFTHQLLEYYASLQLQAIKLTKDTELSHDILQETMYKAFKNKAQFKPGSNLQAWLYIIMRNVFMDHVRSNQKRIKIITDRTIDLLPVIDDSMDTTGSICYKEIMAAVIALPAIYQQPFLLYFNGYSYEEIACITNRNMNTVKGHIHLARRLLKAVIRRY